MRRFWALAWVGLVSEEDCLGALNPYAAEPDAFDDDEIALLQEMATDLVLGLSRLRTTRELAALFAHIERVEQAEAASAAARTLLDRLAPIALCSFS